MFSVTNRIRNISQPRGGYLPANLFTEEKFRDFRRIETIDSAYKNIQGLAVDYLTRFLNGTNKRDAFRISLQGAKKVDETEKAEELLSHINGLDEESIINACQLVGYDVAFRRGPKWFSPIDKIVPTKSLINNIVKMVKRSIRFLNVKGPVVMDGFTFEGAYNDIISSGDGDYLTNDTLWDLKVSSFGLSSERTLQIAVYYVLGVHSIHHRFQYIKQIGIFNPELNIAYTVKLSKISNYVFKEICSKVIGYCTPENPADWKLSSGTSDEAKDKIIKQIYSTHIINTGFSPEHYQDGIHKITLDDYWCYCRDVLGCATRPLYANTETIKLIKSGRFIMFVSVGKSGRLSIMNRGSLRNLSHPIEYYQKHLAEYAQIILNKFSVYWDALYNISKQIRSVAYTENELVEQHKKYIEDNKGTISGNMSYDLWKKIYSREGRPFQGRVHGCIVDIDQLNHIYLNPYDGSIAPYHAPSMYIKHIYSNVQGLLAEHRPEALPAFNRAIEGTAHNELSLVTADSKHKHQLAVLTSEEADTYNVAITDTSMYELSNRMKMLQEIYDHQLIVVWSDGILPEQAVDVQSLPTQV